MAKLYLIIAIIAEVIGTASLKASDGFTKWHYTALSMAAYFASLFLLSLVLKTIPVGVAYAVWSGLGVALITIISFFSFGQKIDAMGLFGIGLIVAGVIVLNVFSTTTMH